MKQISAMVREFHDRFGVPVLSAPTIPSDDRCDLRVALIEEEFKELKEGIAAGDIVEIADALADLNYVIHGAAHEFGIPLDAVSEEVHRSNMTKVWADGTVHVREDGKVLKPPTYTRPQIGVILRGKAY